MSNNGFQNEKVHSGIRIINGSPPALNQTVNSKQEIKPSETTQRKSIDDVDSIKSSMPTSTVFLKAIKITTDAFENSKKNGSTCSTISTRVSFDMDKPEPTEIYADPFQSSYSPREKEYELEEELKQDIIYNPCELDFKIAAQLIQDAIDGTNIEFKHNKISLKLYKLYISKWISWFLYFILLIHIVILPVFEHPAVVEIPFWIPNVIEFICLIIYMLRWAHLKSFQETSTFLKKKTNLIIPIVASLILMDLVQYVIVNSIEVDFKHRFTRPLRILFYTNLNAGEQLKRALKNMAKMLPSVLRIYLLFVITLFAFTYLIWELFRDRNLYFASGDPFFVDYIDGLWAMYVSYTTANFPDVMQPAYNYNGFYGLIFLSYMVLNLYLFGNMTLAAVSSIFKDNLKKDLKRALRTKRRKLETAFNLIKRRISKNGDPTVAAISYHNFSKLMKINDPSKSDLKIKIIFQVLDFAGDSYLHLNEFLYTAETLTFGLSEKRERENIFERFIPNIYKSFASKRLKKIVKDRIFIAIFDLFILANAITIVVRENSIAWIFWSAFIIEMLLKIYTFGPRRYFSRSFNWFDLLVNTGGIITTILLETVPDAYTNGIFDVSIVFRMIPLIRLLRNLKVFSIVFVTLGNLSSSIITYGLMLLSCYYVFIMVGMEIFGDYIKTQNSNESGPIDCSNPKLINTPFALSFYCKNNYNNIFNGLVLMFELMVVNNWNVLVSGFVAVTDRWARLFFVVNHAFSVMIAVNILASLVLEEFWLDCEVAGKTVTQTRMEKRIIECSLNLNEEKQKEDENDNGSHKWTREGLRKSLGAVLESYDTKDISDFSDQPGIKFDIITKRHKSIEMMFQKRITDQINLARDEIFD